MIRRNRRLTRAATAATALSFLDVVSAGFGGAVFLFVVFASFPIEVPPPMVGGGKRFIDVRVEWQKLITEGGLTQNNEPFRELLEDEEWAEAIMEAFARKIYEEDTKEPLDENVAKLILGSEAEVRTLLKLHPEYVVTWNESIGEILPGRPNYEKLKELCGVVNVEEIMKMRWTAVVQNRVECKFNQVADEEDLIEEILDLGKVNRALIEGVKQSKGAGEPVINLHISHTDRTGQINEIMLTELRVDPNTDFVESKNADLPWKFFQIIGFDHFGRYLTLAKQNKMNTMFVRILEPEGGKWQFKANLFSRGGYLNELQVGMGEAIITVNCSNSNEVVRKISFDTGNNAPILINENSSCEFEAHR